MCARSCWFLVFLQKEAQTLTHQLSQREVSVHSEGRNRQCAGAGRSLHTQCPRLTSYLRADRFDLRVRFRVAIEKHLVILAVVIWRVRTFDLHILEIPVRGPCSHSCGLPRSHCPPTRPQRVGSQTLRSLQPFVRRVKSHFGQKNLSKVPKSQKWPIQKWSYF